MKEIRVLHIMNDIERANGSMSVIMNYYRQMYSHNIKFYFLCMKESISKSYGDEIIRYGGGYEIIGNPKDGFLKFRSKLIDFCKTNYGKFDIVHIHLSYLATYCYGIKKMLGAQKLIYHAHSTKFSDTRMKSIRNKILTIPALVNGDEFFGCSKDAGRAIFGKRFERKGRVIQNAINTEKFRRFEESLLRKEFDLESNFIVGHIGTFNEGKNHKFIIDIFNEITKMRPDSVLILVGDGPLKENIEVRVAELGIEEKVIFMGVRTDIPEILNMFDKLVFPSYFEGVPMVMVEAQACGIPCVFSDNITEDVNILKELNVKQSLEHDAKDWALSLLAKKKYGVKDAECFRRSGYDIKNEAENLLHIYQGMLKYKEL